MAKKPAKGKKTGAQFLVPLPKRQGKRPFTLMFVEKAAADRLKPGDLTFSEDIGGFAAEHLAEAESAETTGATPESADTTITF